MQGRSSDDDSEREPKIRFEGEDHPETEKHEKLRRRDTPHYLKNKRIDLQSSDPDKVKEILAKAGGKDSVEGSKAEVVRIRVQLEGVGVGYHINTSKGRCFCLTQHLLKKKKVDVCCLVNPFFTPYPIGPFSRIRDSVHLCDISLFDFLQLK